MPVTPFLPVMQPISPHEPSLPSYHDGIHGPQLTSGHALLVPPPSILTSVHLPSSWLLPKLPSLRSIPLFA